MREEKEKTIVLTEEGVRKAEAFFGVENLTDPENQELYHYILAALRANVLMKRDVDYVVKDGQVIIVDEFTGRLMIGRRYSDGLHQAIEAKEGVKVERENRTLATITFQNYFRMYKKLSGMTGTAKTEEEEFQGIYKLDVVTIPTNKPMIRKDLNDAVFVTQKAKFAAVIEEIVKRHRPGSRCWWARCRWKRANRLQAAGKARRAPRGAERQVPRKGSGDRRPGRQEGRGDHRHQHGRPRHRHPAGRQRRVHGPQADAAGRLRRRGHRGGHRL